MAAKPPGGCEFRAIQSPTVTFEDNQGAVALAKNPRDHPRTKHIDVKYHYIRQAIETKLIELCYCPTTEMLADAMTTGLPKETCQKFRLQMGVVNVQQY